MAAEPESGFATDRTRLGGASALVATAALISFAGEQWVAVVGALAVPVAWYLAGPTYAFAVGHLALVAVLPERAIVSTVDLARAGAVEAGLVGVLVATVRPVGPRRSTPGASVGLLVVLAWILAGGVLAWASARPLLEIPTAAGLVVALAAFTTYGLHRYRLVSLGLAGETDE
ncbi:hypothetical protein NGM10_16800 (plasmid) [Halorussus salilacus]|uniref:hypothetical protein n=1 Tax=Halorussus salilacus TaxID=2953750 RepID=UPI0020A22554|nr:hypothetical protein [Halorussus salilacus]USZ69755.1 hypothetical protein NGM10_16800 [Halorussus salilacus]